MKAFSKISNHSFFKALDKGRQRGTRGTGILLPALGEQPSRGRHANQREGECRGMWAPSICIRVSANPRSICIRICLCVTTEGMKQPSEMKAPCERPRKKDCGKSFPEKVLSNSKELRGPLRISLQREMQASDRMRERGCAKNQCIINWSTPRTEVQERKKSFAQAGLSLSRLFF